MLLLFLLLDHLEQRHCCFSCCARAAAALLPAVRANLEAAPPIRDTTAALAVLYGHQDDTAEVRMQPHDDVALEHQVVDAAAVVAHQHQHKSLSRHQHRRLAPTCQ